MLKILIICAVAFSFVSCKAKRGKLSRNGELSGVSTELNYLWKKDEFVVCWHSKESDLREFKNEVEEFVVANLQKVPIKWKGWKTCGEEGDEDVKLFIYDNPSVKTEPKLQALKEWRQDTRSRYPGHPSAYIGTRAVGHPVSVVLNVTGEDAVPVYRDTLNRMTDKGKKNLILSMALHEITHLLGVNHEDMHQERLNGKHEECKRYTPKNPNQPDDSIRLETAYDAKSIMNRCFYRGYEYDQGHLGYSQGDIELLRIMFLKHRDS